MDEFLNITPSLDYNKSNVKNKALEIVTDTSNNTEKALSIFNWMKDNIKFAADATLPRASKTLKRGFGACNGRSTLHIALLRAVDIPARMGFAYLKSELLEPIIPSFLFGRFPPKIGHVWTECYLDDKWISCETFYDTLLYEKLLEKKILTKEQVPTIDWDGKTDLIILKHWFLGDKGNSIGSSDDLNLKEPFLEKLIGPIVYKKALLHTEKIRNE